MEQASLFLGDKDRTVEVLVEETDGRLLADHPFIKANKEALERGNLTVRRLKPEFAEGVAFNFSVMDDNGYRFEADKGQPVASAAFGSEPFVGRLRSIYDVLWKQGSNPLTPATN